MEYGTVVNYCFKFRGNDRAWVYGLSTLNRPQGKLLLLLLLLSRDNVHGLIPSQRDAGFWIVWLVETFVQVRSPQNIALSTTKDAVI